MRKNRFWCLENMKNITEAIDDPKDIQFILKEYWNNLPAAEKEHFSQSSSST